MKVLARAAISSLAALGIGLVAVVVVLATIGIMGTRASERLGNSITSDELITSTATGQLAQDMDTVYATGEEAFLAPGPPGNHSSSARFMTRLLPAADTQLAYLERLHAGDPRHEYASLEQFVSAVDRRP